MEMIIQSNEHKIKEKCMEGLKRDFQIEAKEVSIPLTNICNNHCIMCHACSKDYENHTYFNETPYSITIEEYKKIVKGSKRNFLEKIFKVEKINEDKISFVFGSAESLLNSDIYDIVKYTKETYPNCSIRLISNGTIPPQKDIVRYIDRIGFSIDGCTAETFERLRPPAKFEHVMKCIRKWDESAEEYNPSFSFGFATVVSTENLHELTGIVELASSFKHIDSVYVQPILLHETRQHLSHMLLKNVTKELMEKTIDELRLISEKVNVRVDGMNSLISQEVNETVDYRIDNAKYCRYMWNGIISLTQKGDLRYFCCYMDAEKTKELLKKYSIPNNLSIGEMYNCSEYWQLRKDMIDGKLIDYCEGCSFVNTGYNNLSQKEVDFMETPYV